MKKFFIALLVVCAFALPAFAERIVIEAGSVEELVAAIAPGRTIRLKPGRYDITEAAGTGASVTWAEKFDGMELNIIGVKDLTIEGSGSATTEIVVTPMYADVMAFNGCENITIKGVTMGHVKTGDCVGNVLTFTDVKGVTLDDVDLYGCGVIGIELNSVRDLKVTDSVIRDCSNMVIMMEDVRNASFSGTKFSHFGGMIRGGGQIQDITFDSCTFEQKCLYGEEGPWMTIAFWEDSDIRNFVVDSVVVTESEPCPIEELFFGVRTENVTIRAANTPHDASCGPDGLSREYHREMAQADARTDMYEAIGREHDRQNAWMDEYIARVRENASAERAKALDNAQAAWGKWRKLDFEFLDLMSFGDADMLRFDLGLDEQVRRTVLLRREALGPDGAGWKFEPPAGDPRPARDKISRDGEGYSSRFTKAIGSWDGNTGKFLDIVQAEIELQDKWLNELYKGLRAKLNDEQKTALRDAQRAWLAWREADSAFIYDPDGGSIARMNANSDFLDKLVRRVVLFEELIERY